MRYALVILIACSATALPAAAQNAPSEAEALRRDLADLQAALQQAQQDLAAAQAELRDLQEQKLGSGGEVQFNAWQAERDRLRREQRMLLHERQRLDSTRQTLHRTMRVEAQRLENAALTPPPQPRHAAPQAAAVPTPGYNYQYGPGIPYAGYSSGYYAEPGYGYYGRTWPWLSPLVFHFGSQHRHHDHHGHHGDHGHHDRPPRRIDVPVPMTRDYFPSSGTYSPWRPVR